MQCMDDLIQKIVQLDHDLEKRPQEEEFTDTCNPPVANSCKSSSSS